MSGRCELTLVQLGKWYGAIADLIVAGAYVQAGFAANPHRRHLRQANFYQGKGRRDSALFNLSALAIDLPRFRFACFHSSFDISSVQVFLMSSDMHCSIQVSSGLRFLNQISNLVVESPVCAVRPMSEVLMLFL